MDSNLAQRRAGLEDKIPDIKKTLMMVEFLQDRRVRCFYVARRSLTSLQEGKSKAAEDDLDDEDDLEDGGSQKPLTTTFELNDTLYAEAELEDTDTVYLWLGVCRLFHEIVCILISRLEANVMLSYQIPAAVTLLKSKLEAAELSLKNTIEDLDYLREQITVMEVNTARVYNWDIKRRREKRLSEQASSSALAKTAEG
jgi:hypothetical protein